MQRRLKRGLLTIGGLLIVAAVALAVWARSELRGSLPQLDGSRSLPGLSAPVTVTRDELGVPTVRGATREDVARATGFLHAQDRFFQMDLQRRRAAGELSALVGARALAADREIRIHRFRNEARQAVALLGPRDRGVLTAYTAGVNEGLRALRAAPFEYVLLRQAPEPWREEDSLLVVLAMFITLQDSDASYESTLGTMHDLLPPEVFDFLAPRGTEWDAPVTGAAFDMPAIPGADVFNPRVTRAGHPTSPRLSKPRDVAAAETAGVFPWDTQAARSEAIGSNSWAVSGARTANGSALLANDMHLGIRVPNTWYRAVLVWPDASQPGDISRLIGVTLPGVPALVTGSNTYLAWGFTNTYADWGDVVMLEIDPSNTERYRTPDGWRTFERFDESIAVAGQPAQHEEVRWTIWGPVLEPDYRGRPRAYRWVAHSAEQLAANLTPLEDARTLSAALAGAHGIGTPGQNIVIADRSGHVAWTVYGSIPNRVNLDGQLPSSWADGERKWDGWLQPSDYPAIVDPPDGRIWTANNRVVDGEMLKRLGDGSYEVGSRANIIRERLRGGDHFTPRDFLDIQLDTRATFLERWRRLLLDTLSAGPAGDDSRRAELRRVVDQGWTGTAAPDSAAYRLTRAFRDLVSERVFAFLLGDCYDADASFDYTTVRRREGPLWKVVTERPMHMLDPQYASWEQMLLDTIDTVIEEATQDHSGALDQRVWSEVNVTVYRHPLSGALPFVGRWLDMPSAAIPGDLYTPRVASGAVAASDRMIVSPGRESEGLMQMPTGQSGHPLSPFYANSHPAWIEGRPTPLLPGRAQHSLTLVPK